MPLVLLVIAIIVTLTYAIIITIAYKKSNDGMAKLLIEFAQTKAALLKTQGALFSASGE